MIARWLCVRSASVGTMKEERNGFCVWNPPHARPKKVVSAFKYLGVILPTEQPPSDWFQSPVSTSVPTHPDGDQHDLDANNVKVRVTGFTSARWTHKLAA